MTPLEKAAHLYADRLPKLRADFEAWSSIHARETNGCGEARILPTKQRPAPDEGDRVISPYPENRANIPAEARAIASEGRKFLAVGPGLPSVNRAAKARYDRERYEAEHPEAKSHVFVGTKERRDPATCTHIEGGQFMWRRDGWLKNKTVQRFQCRLCLCLGRDENGTVKPCPPKKKDACEHSWKRSGLDARTGRPRKACRKCKATEWAEADMPTLAPGPPRRFPKHDRATCPHSAEWIVDYTKQSRCLACRKLFTLAQSKAIRGAA
jgi:hypothetical protein